MLNFNKKGFAFSELLMVTVVVIGIFMVIYTNIFPIMGELENRDKYNDVSANYVAFYLRKALLDQQLKLKGEYEILYSKDNYKISGLLENYKNYLSNADVEKVILTSGHLLGLKKESDADDLSDIADYIDYLPVYNNLSNDSEQYRLIIKTSSGYATTLIKISKDDYNYMFDFNDSDMILGIKNLNDPIIYIPDFVTGINNIFDWGEIEVIYLNSLIKGSSRYIDLKYTFNSFANSSSGRNLTLKIYDCKKGEEEGMKKNLSINNNNIYVQCLQEVSNE